MMEAVRSCTPTRLHCPISQKALIFVLATARTWNPTSWYVVFKKSVRASWTSYLTVTWFSWKIGHCKHTWSMSDDRNYLADKISHTFGSRLVVPITRIVFKCACDYEIRYLDLTYFLEFLHSKKAVKRFLVAFFQNSCTSTNGQVLSGGCSKSIRISTSHVIWNFVISKCFG
jgi:hypothetical protein